VILEVLDLSRNELQRKGISIRTQLATAKPLVRGDRIQLQQLVLNLISRGRCDERAGRRATGVVDLYPEEGANEILVEVRDSGHGLSPRTMERISDPFFTTKPDGMEGTLHLPLDRGRPWWPPLGVGEQATGSRLPVRASGGRARYLSKRLSRLS